ncbi:elongation factor P 5-aminopentanone reductase [Lachnotalea glycerini]|uniref:SDR family NAD(P)-dependent oxidoreductase n=1 Tax=Lachnotalea glycerini TaxID=1763509 RepID=A0A371JHI8_9FIRM|nr:SDR family NAD(P)-dependent oxidoreductase [Lachnotalea glycerini]RDY32193.1 SDR family NAD(P)-dependent oxidoreductase [Lachnotalea glycerini]
MEKKTVLITGASKGIGYDTTIKFAKEGFKNIIITGNKSIEKLETLKHNLEEIYHCNCMSFIGDLGKYENVELLFDKITTLYKGIDILVNNAGISHLGLLSEMTIEDWNHIISTNLSSVFHCSKLAIPYMVHQKSGKIINISSVWGICGASYEVAYSASKGGVNAFTKALAKELAPSNIQVNAIACGVIDTQMNQFLDEAERASLIEEIPSNRIGSPDEVADLVYDLAKGHQYLTGQVIKLDGGWI